ncbi:MAG: EAL domain-containing protein [Pseudomonadota bacterium]
MAGAGAAMGEATGGAAGGGEEKLGVALGADAVAALAAGIDAMFAGMDAPARALRRAVSALGAAIDDVSDEDAAAEATEANGAASKARQRLSGVMQMADEVAQRLDHVRIAEERIAAEAPEIRAVVRQVLARQLQGVAEDIRDRRDENVATLAELDAALERIAGAAPDAPVSAAHAAAKEMEAATLAPMEEAIAGLSRAAEAMSVAAGKADPVAMPDWLEPLYTMQEERRLHTAALAELGGNDGEQTAPAPTDAADATGEPGSVTPREAALAGVSRRLPKAESPAGFRLAFGSVLVGLVVISTLIALGRGGTPTWPGLGIFLIAHALATFGAASMLFRSGNARLARLRDEMERLAFRDSLTGLINRRGLTRLVHGWLSAEGERRPRAVAVMNIDLDHFKAVNDTLGHDAGDHVLAVAAERMVACLGDLPAGREEHDDAAVCRTGGDEFCVVLSGEKMARAEEIAGAIVAETAKKIDYEGNACQIGASIGIAYGGGAEGSCNVERLLADADLATYVAKEEGRGRFAIFDPELRAEQEAEAQLAGALIRALSGQAEEAEGQIEIWFQPCIAMPAGDVVAAEALVRWRHAVLGDVPPERLLAAAERNGLGERLSAEIARQVVGAVAAWQQAGIEAPLVTLNLGETELRSRDLPKRLAAAMAEAGLAPGQIGVEAAEASATGRGDVLAQETLSTLRGGGAPVLVDRFGRDAVALSTISAMSATAVKLDRGLVGQLGEDSEGITLLKGLVTLARSLSLNVVASGVETRAQLDLLRAAGCDAMQGFAVARPEPAESFAAWLSFADVVPAAACPLAFPPVADGKAKRAAAS